jgi:hypothetical protein
MIKIDREKTEDLWLEVVDKDDQGNVWASAQLKWDGCVHYTKYMIEPMGLKSKPEDRGYIHVCSLRQHIKELQEMERIAIEHFQDRYVEYWPKP